MSGVYLLAGFGVAMAALALIFTRGTVGKEGFLVANRELGLWPSALSIAATWTWAPALFIASQMAYQKGVIGLFWFVVPNVLCLIIFSEFAARLRDRMPQGYTLPEFMGKIHSARVKRVYLVQMIGLSTCSFAVQLLAGGMIFSTLTGLPFLPVTLALSFIALSYSLWSGLKSSVLTDYVQTIIIFAVAGTLIPWAIFNAGGWSVVQDGMGGISGQFTNIFSKQGLDVFLAFGLATTIGLLSGPFGDQSFWQRALATKKEAVRRAFILGAFIFGAIPLSLSLLGFLAAGAGLETDNAQLINIQTVLEFLPSWTAIPFTVMLLAGLISTLDSCLCAVSSMTGSDFDSKKPVAAARTGMLLLALGAVLIANIPGMQILYLFLFYGTLRAATMLPTILSLTMEKLSEPGVFYGLLASICVGLPVFAYGNFNQVVPFIVVGSLLTVLLSGGIAYITTRRMNDS